MELWIRSQDKKGLFKIDNVGINDYNGYYYVVSVINNEEVKLGRYDFHSSTRALEVLDEIIDLMLPTKTSFDENGEYSCKGCFVNKNMVYYEMPKE